ncbi:MAG: hypothetical protein HDQ96_02485 [Lachnospiraceae bacterium]|nr:hypothetical protein [Lachnospiraceae bacterium]
MYKLLIWGTGKRANGYMKERYFEGNIIEGFVDSARKAKLFYGYPVFEPQEAYNISKEIDYIIIANTYYEDIYKMLRENDVPEEKIIFTDCIHELPYINDDEIVKKISLKLYEKMAIQSSKRMIGMNEKDKLDSRRIIGTSGFDEKEYMMDYFRYRTFEFIANELIDNKIEGKVAEVGVFRGTFAKLINEKFKDRDFFLFDTFEGFNEEEVAGEMRIGRCDEIFKDRYKQTSEDIVLNRLKYPEKCMIFKGLFPDTVSDEVKESQFAFVSLDVDLEESTYQGIQFFYPRLVVGGYLYIHDYNSSHLSGVKRAVERYEEDNQVFLKKIPLADQSGTLVVIK